MSIRTWHELREKHSRSAISRLRSNGTYVKLLPGIYSVGEPTIGDRCAAVGLWNKSAVLTHCTAAGLYRWIDLPDVFEISVPRSTSSRTPAPWISLHRRTLPEVSIVDGPYRMTTKAQTLLDCAGVMNDFDTAHLIDHRSPAERTAASTLASTNPNQPGVTKLRHHVAMASSNFWSEPERRLDRALHELGFFLEVNFPIGRYKADLADILGRVLIEVDGFEYHSRRKEFRHDRVRQNWLMKQGWFILRYTAYDVMENPGRCAADIAEIIRRRRKARR